MLGCDGWICKVRMTDCEGTEWHSFTKLAQKISSKLGAVTNMLVKGKKFDVVYYFLNTFDTFPHRSLVYKQGENRAFEMGLI